MEGNNKIFIPTFISSVDYQPVRVLPHIYFWNGLRGSDSYYIEGFANGTTNVVPVQFESFPYFDNYSENTPSTASKSLLFNNEVSVYGEAPSASLYTEYWENYVSLLYNPKTRLLNCSAIIPLNDYFKMELNDIVDFRGNYYHLRAINDYNLETGECNLQLLGPIIPDSFDDRARVLSCCTPTITDIEAGECGVDLFFTLPNNFYCDDVNQLILYTTQNGETSFTYVSATLSPLCLSAPGSTTIYSLRSECVGGGTSDYSNAVTWSVA